MEPFACCRSRGLASFLGEAELAPRHSGPNGNWGKKRRARECSGGAVKRKGCPEAPRLHQFFAALDRERRQRVAGPRSPHAAPARPCHDFASGLSFSSSRAAGEREQALPDQELEARPGARAGGGGVSDAADLQRVAVEIEEHGRRRRGSCHDDFASGLPGHELEARFDAHTGGGRLSHAADPARRA